MNGRTFTQNTRMRGKKPQYTQAILGAGRFDRSLARPAGYRAGTRGYEGSTGGSRCKKPRWNSRKEDGGSASGGFFLACEDFGRMFGYPFPVCVFAVVVVL